MLTSFKDTDHENWFLLQDFPVLYASSFLDTISKPELGAWAISDHTEAGYERVSQEISHNTCPTGVLLARMEGEILRSGMGDSTCQCGCNPNRDKLTFISHQGLQHKLILEALRCTWATSSLLRVSWVFLCPLTFNHQHPRTSLFLEPERVLFPTGPLSPMLPQCPKLQNTWTF